MSDVIESKQEESAFDAEIFHTIGESLFNQESDLGNATKTSPNIRKQGSSENESKGNTLKQELEKNNLTECVEIRKTTFQPEKLQLKDRFSVTNLFVPVLAASLFYNIYQFHETRSLIHESRLNLGKAQDWQQKYNDMIKLSWSDQKVDINSIIVDNCWIKARIGECAQNLYTTTANDMQGLVSGWESLASDAFDSVKELESQAMSLSESLSDVIVKAASDLGRSTTELERDLSYVVDSLGKCAMNVTEGLVGSIGEGLQFLFDDSSPDLV
mmetsp:Transcript_11369/g.11397  ORF Transcript_11369/g.11397 Transcript_11369/m.11397 type:complete len:271 (-) Transcript_11369:236-1048(-)|eukprot:CAMPEP_0182429144 /NCGR_PEP_ID=MMETSP1167-20130531/25547_1 /TAXON_ID=2988 /ORGANISM="Mallomonas Sp, Strain CCMP3275" /LENGTH=270 /DNA_ID=CAMNT_0024612495 /DNA_START=66 /DNA_END=878 /DNA_ORIENTATION=-